MASPNPLGRYSGNRLFEWVMAASFFNMGVVLLWWPGTLAAGNFRPLLSLLGPRELTAICLTAGVVRAVTLLLNGRLGRLGPIVRAIMAGIGIVICLEMTSALWLHLGQPSFTTGILAALAGGELLSIARARRDLHGS